MSSSADRKRDASGGAPARAVAAKIIERLAAESSYLAPSISAELDRHPQLSTHDRQLVFELCYGVTRTRQGLLQHLARHAEKGLKKKDMRLESHLLVAAYQLLVLDRIPAFAAIDSAVSEIKKARGAGLAGFANALLRKLHGSGARLSVAEGLLATAPGWLTERLEAQVGTREMRALLGIKTLEGRLHFEVPPTWVRLIPGRPVPHWLADAPESRWVQGAREVTGKGELRQAEGFGDAYVVHEEGAQILAWLLGARPGEAVLDACAGRGNKTLLLAERVMPHGKVVASDLYPRKLEQLKLAASRLGYPIETRAHDMASGVEGFPGGFDRVLVDAPCTSVGTLRRRPEILWRLRPEDPARMSRITSAILRNAARLAKPGGHVTFAVCSVLPEECEKVLEEVRDMLEPAPFDADFLAGLPDRERLAPEGEWRVRLLPERHGTDGYFVASLRRIG